MHIELLKFCSRIHALILSEDGQDLIEYALVVALIASAATTGMSSVASSINTTFGTIATTLSSQTS